MTKCPYCGKEMEDGYLQSAHGIYWTKNPKKLQFNSGKDDINLSNTGVFGSKANAFKCDNCSKIIVDYKK